MRHALSLCFVGLVLSCYAELARPVCRASNDLPEPADCFRIANAMVIEAIRDKRRYRWGKDLLDSPTTRKLPHTWGPSPGHGPCSFTLDVLPWHDDRSQAEMTLMDVAFAARKIASRCLWPEGEQRPRIGYNLYVRGCL